jgi:threonine synthase
MKFWFRCRECGSRYDELHMLCPQCQNDPAFPPRGILETFIEDPGLTESWTPRDLLPLDSKYFPQVPVGNTALWEPERIRSQSGFSRLYLKDETQNPSESLKDRASFLVAAQARYYGFSKIVLASTGNAGSSMACIGAAAGLEVLLFLPESAPEAKLVQALQYGAEVRRVNGSYDDAYDASLEYCEKHAEKVLSRNTGHNPFTIEGKKTAALELVRELGNVDHLFVSVGDGVILSSLYKGFEDAIHFGLCEKMPCIYGVQAEGSSAIHRALEKGVFTAAQKSSTVADSISVDIPRAGMLALDKLQKHRGKTIVVSDKEILEAQWRLSSGSGLFGEPAAAAAYAGFEKIKDSLERTAVTVILITGSGLKDIRSAQEGVKP